MNNNCTHKENENIFIDFFNSLQSFLTTAAATKPAGNRAIPLFNISSDSGRHLQYIPLHFFSGNSGTTVNARNGKTNGI